MSSFTCFTCKGYTIKEYKVLIDREEKIIFLCNRCRYHIEIPDIK